MVKRIVAIVLASAASAAAQPALTPAYSYQPALTDDERDLLVQGEISHDRVVGGVILDGLVGYGLGQALQHRWTETGWIFTVGEGAGTIGFVYGMARAFSDCLSGPGGPHPACSNGNNLMLGSAIAVLAFRAASMIDAGLGPARHNARVRALRDRVAPVAAVAADGAVAGLALRF